MYAEPLWAREPRVPEKKYFYTCGQLADGRGCDHLRKENRENDGEVSRQGVQEMAQSSRPSPLHRGSLQLDGPATPRALPADATGIGVRVMHPSMLLYYESYDHGYPSAPRDGWQDDGGEG